MNLIPTMVNSRLLVMCMGDFKIAMETLNWDDISGCIFYYAKKRLKVAYGAR